MPLTEAIRAYFTSEIMAVWYFTLPGGVLVIAAGIAAIRTEWSGFYLTLGVGCILYGLAMVSYAATVHLRTPQQVKTLQVALEKNPKTALVDELNRARKHAKGLERALLIFGIAGAIGFVLRFTPGQEWAIGLGSVLVLAAGITFVIDGLGVRRAQSYVVELEKLIGAAEVAPAVERQ